MTVLRIATKDDVDRLTDLEQRTVQVMKAYASKQMWARAVEDNCARCLVTEDDSVLLGAVILGKGVDGTPDPGEIELLLVDPEYQGLGFGKMILSSILDQNDELGKETRLDVFNGNARAIRLYRSLGFHDETALRRPDIYPRNFLLMVRPPQ